MLRCVSDRFGPGGTSVAVAVAVAVAVVMHKRRAVSCPAFAPHGRALFKAELLDVGLHSAMVEQVCMYLGDVKKMPYDNLLHFRSTFLCVHTKKVLLKCSKLP